MTRPRQSSDAVRVPLALLLDPAQPQHGAKLYASFSADPGVTSEQLAERLGMSKRTVDRTIAGLVELGWITRTRIVGSRSWNTTTHNEPQLP